MRKNRKLNLRKLSIARLDMSLVTRGVKGGTDLGTNDVNCQTNEVNCQTSVKTRPEFTDPNGPNLCEPTYTYLVGPCI
ncbi:hypothetical protein [uncultured Kordia sp.]|uniref:hypothetical protein n=1 Tax=uncultured Kordia sp. TaxID=507699 RepID=UPI002619D495|nr:hypothetical protein [uncultured Kordia sp.]